jgi:hypothetical protein
MRVRMSKSIFAGLAALIVLIAVSVSTPAAAFRMGGGGFHGGGFHGGGFGGGFHGGGFGGWRGGGFGGWRGGYGWEGGVGATVAGAVAAGDMPDGAIRGGGGAIRMAMAMTMGRDGVPITPPTATPPPTVEAAPAGSIAKSGRSLADEAATSGGGSSTSANRSPERPDAGFAFCLFYG